MGTFDIPTLLRLAVIFGAGVLLMHYGARALGQLVRRRVSEQAGMLTHKGVLYGTAGVMVVLVLQHLGFNLTAVLGAAGIAGVAIGFAAQTSLSNIISGLFLISEKPFQVGDVIKVDATVGVVLSIDLLAVGLRTFDNQYVRIPNETMIKTQVTNITRYPIRRMDFTIAVPFDADVARVMQVLRDVCDANAYALDEPEPFIMLQGYRDSAFEVLLGAWFHKDDFVQMRNTLWTDLRARLRAEGLEVPYPHRVVVSGEGPHEPPAAPTPPPAGP